MSGAGQWLLILVLGLSLLRSEPLSAAAPVALQSSGLTLVSPAACPAAGCAPGQRMNLRFEFELADYDPTPTVPPEPNVKVCFYAPDGWIDQASVNAIEQPGGVTGQPYTYTPDCVQGEPTRPTGYTPIGAWQAAIVNNAFSDSLNLSFRIAAGATSTGKLLARLFERTGPTWNRTQQVFTPNLPVTAASALSYVAADASLCDAGGYQPCYLNSGDDLPDGIGTGLKDAVDAVQDGSVLYVLGNYPIKSNTVLIKKAIQISGLNNASLTSTGSVCTNAMLRLETGVTVSELAINDGPGCTTTNRTLIEVNSPRNVLIEYNQLSGGEIGVLVRDNIGAVTVRSNQIENNAAQAVYADSGTIFSLTVEGNNITGNGAASSGVQIECAAGLSGAAPSRSANHNYWGSPAQPSQEATHCTLAPGRQLGAPIQPRAGGAAGVQAQRFTVTGSKTYAYNNEIAFQRTGGSADFDLYVVNHGYAQITFTPFNLGGGPNPCSNFWDVFLPDGVIPDGTLELFLKYNKSAACVAAINSTQYCDQTSAPGRYPLWWYDPAGGVTEQWDTTGQNPAGSNAGGGSGQATACRIADNEIQVSIDSSGRPNLVNDLNYLPLFTGVQVLNTYRLLASNNVITVDWSTNHEPDVTGFYIQRSTDGVNFSPITDLIARKGSALAGASYQFVDSGRLAGTSYSYRLQIVRPDNTFLYSQVLSSLGTAATATRTFTPGPTATNTRTPGPTPTYTVPPPTRTRTPTRVPVQNPTRVGSATLTRRAATPTRLALTLPTAGTPDATNETPSNQGTGYPAPGEEATTLTQEGAYPAPGEETGGTAVAGLISPTVPAGESSGIEPEPNQSPPGPNIVPLALLSGYFGGSALLGLLGLWYLVIYKKHPSLDP